MTHTFYAKRDSTHGSDEDRAMAYQLEGPFASYDDAFVAVKSMVLDEVTLIDALGYDSDGYCTSRLNTIYDMMNTHQEQTDRYTTWDQSGLRFQVYYVNQK